MATAHHVVRLPSASERKPRKVIPPVWQGIEYSCFPPGVYDVCCIKIQGPEWLKNHRRWSIRLECNLMAEEGNVSGFLNLGDDPKRCSARRQSKYFKLWCKVNGGLPRKGQEMHWNDFIGKLFRAVLPTPQIAMENRCRKQSVTPKSRSSWSA